MKESESPPAAAYPEAFDATVQAIHDRAVRYRSLALGVGLALIAAPIAAALARAWAPLLLLLALLPACTLFFVLDMRRLTRWQQQVLRLWAGQRVELSIFRESMRMKPGLPPQTLESMLDTLPRLEPADATTLNSAEAREAVRRLVECLQRYRERRLLILTLTQATVLVAAALALVQGSPVPLLLLLLTPLVIGAGYALNRRSALACGEAIRQPLRDEGQRGALRHALGWIDWSDVPARIRTRLTEE
jgi:hypothetical protein